MTCFLFLLMLASPALAASDDARGTATVAWRHAPADKAVVGDRLWRCAGETCSGGLTDRPASRLRACRTLARFAGQVVRFETPSGALGDGELARCNKGLR